MYNIYGGWAVDWMGETDTFGNNGTKKKIKSNILGTVVINNNIRTRSIYHPCVQRKLRICHYFVRNDENREFDRNEWEPVRAFCKDFQPDRQG